MESTDLDQGLAVPAAGTGADSADRDGGLTDIDDVLELTALLEKGHDLAGVCGGDRPGPHLGPDVSYRSR